MRNLVFLLSVFSLVFLSCNDSDIAYEDRIKSLQDEIAYLQESNGTMLDRMTELAVINSEDASTINESLRQMGEQQEYISELTNKIHQKDSVNFALVSNLKSSLIDVNDDDVQIEVKGSAVYVSLSDKLLFRSASAKVSSDAYYVLGKVAKIINDQPEIQVLVQGHTDDLPIANKHYRDNWDLSTSRALSVIRILQDKYEVFPGKLTAAGRGEFDPKIDNDDAAGRKANRRTEIILKPQLGQFFELLTVPELQDLET